MQTPPTLPSLRLPEAGLKAATSERAALFVEGGKILSIDRPSAEDRARSAVKIDLVTQGNPNFLLVSLKVA